MSDARAAKVLAIVALYCIGGVLGIIAITPVASGYELSIYDAYPSYFWALLTVGSSVGVTILVLQAFAKIESNWWLAGLAIVLLCISVLICLRTFRGYPLSNPQDLNYHHRYIQDILTTGHITSSNFYPIVHLLVGTWMQITGLPEKLSVDWAMISLVAAYLLGMYLLAKSITVSQRDGLLVTAFAAIPMFGEQLYLHPAGDSMLLVPLFLFVYHRIQLSSSSQTGELICLLILAFSLSFFHPVTALFVAVILLIFKLASIAYLSIPSGQQAWAGGKGWVWRDSVPVAIIVFIVFFAWYSCYGVFYSSFKGIFEWLIYDVGEPVAISHMNLLSEAGLTFWQTLEVFFNRYGAITLCFLVSFSIIAILFVRSLRRREKSFDVLIFTYGFQFILVGALCVFMFIGQVTIFNLIRIMIPAILMSVILNGLAVSIAIPTKRFVMVPLLLVLLVCSSISVLNFHRSPHTGYPNHQTTHMEVAGTQWLLTCQEAGARTLRTHARVEHYQHYVMSDIQLHEIGRIHVAGNIPPHFGYNQSEAASLSEALGHESGYMVTCKLDRIFPLTFPENVRSAVTYQYNEQGFDTLNSDKLVMKSYTNGEFSVWRVL